MNVKKARNSSISAEHLGMKQLDPDFKPSDNDVICARGKEVYNHEGNRRFRALVKQHLHTYSSCVTKMQKSRLVNFIVGTVRQASPNGGFVKKIDDRWYAVTDRHAREKCGQTMRDLLHTRYSSSTKAKARNRQQNRLSRTCSEGAERILVDQPIRTRFSLERSKLGSSPNQPGPASSSFLRRSNCFGGDRGRRGLGGQASLSLRHSVAESIDGPMYQDYVQSSYGKLPLRTASAGPILSASSAGTFLSTPQKLEDLFFQNDLSEDLSLSTDDLDPLPLDGSSHEFKFDDSLSSSTPVSAESFSEAVDTLFECLHIQ